MMTDRLLRAKVKNSQNVAKSISGRGNINPLSALVPNVISFPPAVISLAEKRLMNEQSEKKKNSQNLQNPLEDKKL
jgi:hypothetical protein